MSIYLLSKALSSPPGTGRINVDTGAPSSVSVSISQIRDASGYSVQTQTAADMVSVSDGVSVVAFTGSTAGTATITTPANPVDGQRLRIFSVAGITTLTLTANTGQTVSSSGLPASLSANTFCEYIYKSSNATWYRIA